MHAMEGIQTVVAILFFSSLLSLFCGWLWKVTILDGQAEFERRLRRSNPHQRSHCIQCGRTLKGRRGHIVKTCRIHGIDS